MTITPQVAKFLKILSNANLDWANARARGDDMEVTVAIEDIKRTLTAFRASCPHCGGQMTEIHHDNANSMASTVSHCSACLTLVTIMTPNE